MQTGDDKVIDYDVAVSLFGGLIRTVAYQPAVFAGFLERAEDLTGGPTSAKDDYEALAELFIQTLTRNLKYSDKGPVRVVDFIDRVADLLNAEVIEKSEDEPKSCRTLDNIPVSAN